MLAYIAGLLPLPCHMFFRLLLAIPYVFAAAALSVLGGVGSCSCFVSCGSLSFSGRGMTHVAYLFDITDVRAMALLLLILFCSSTSGFLRKNLTSRLVSSRLVSSRLVSSRLVSSGLVWSGLVWSGLVWSGLVSSRLVSSRLVSSRLVSSRLVWSGLVWSGLVWSGLVWSGLVWSGLVWSGLVWSGLVWSGLVWSGLVWSGLVWSGLVWSGLVWSGLVWSGLVWSGLVWLCVSVSLCDCVSVTHTPLTWSLLVPCDPLHLLLDCLLRST